MTPYHQPVTTHSVSRYPGSTHAHNRLVADALLALGRIHGLVRAWPQETGAAYREDKLTGRKKWVHYGVKGGADISGILMLGGLRIEAEAKTGTAQQQRNQMDFERMIRSAGGIYIVFRTPEGLLDLLVPAAAALTGRPVDEIIQASRGNPGN